jgi:dihydrofolate reductase
LSEENGPEKGPLVEAPRKPLSRSLSRSLISLIAAVSENGVIGRDQKLPWHLPEDFKRFKEITYGAPVIMGRKTYESIGRLLPGRKNIIITRSHERIIPGAYLASSLEGAIELAGEAAEIFILGGGEIYRLALPIADRLYITEVDVKIDGETTFPEWPALRRSGRFRETKCEERPADPATGRPSFRFLVFERLDPE